MSATDSVTLQGGSSAYPAGVPSQVKFVYGIGAAAEAIIGVAFNAFNFFFYTNIMGIPLYGGL